jgi:hypothetical protein
MPRFFHTPRCRIEQVERLLVNVHGECGGCPDIVGKGKEPLHQTRWVVTIHPSDENTLGFGQRPPRRGHGHVSQNDAASAIYLEYPQVPHDCYRTGAVIIRFLISKLRIVQIVVGLVYLEAFQPSGRVPLPECIYRRDRSNRGPPSLSIHVSGPFSEIIGTPPFVYS